MELSLIEESTSTEKILRSLRGDIAIVGNATTKEALGEQIDAFSNVIRFNQYKTTGYEHLVGEKTTLACVSGHPENNYDGQATRIHPLPRFAFKWVLPQGVVHYCEEVNVLPYIRNTLKYHLPSTGFTLCCLLEELEIQATVFNFDGLRTPHYFDQGSIHPKWHHGLFEMNVIVQMKWIRLFGSQPRFQVL